MKGSLLKAFKRPSTDFSKAVRSRHLITSDHRARAFLELVEGNYKEPREQLEGRPGGPGDLETARGRPR